MCGLIGYISKTKSNDAGRHVVTQFQDQMSRGKEGFGVVDIMKEKINIERATEPIKALMDARLSEASVMIFHHRYPTSTVNKIKQTHPFLISHDELSHDFCVMHNGVIKNAKDLFKEHTEELGYTYSTLIAGKTYTHTQYSLSDDFNDSESLAIEIARYFNGNIKEIGAIGDTAFFAIRLDKETGKPIELLWGRDNGRPLEVLESEHGILIASDINDADHAETIAENTFEVLDLQKYFNSKAKVYDVYSKIQQGEMEFKQPPEPAKPTFGFGANHSVPAKSNSSTTQKNSSTGEGTSSTGNIDDDIETEEMLEDIDSGYLRDGYMTPRETAFNTMGERVCDEINGDIMLFFENLAYEDLGEDDAILVANRLNDVLLEKIESARAKVRPHFDQRESQEIEDIVYEDENSGYKFEEDDDTRLSDLVGTQKEDDAF